MIDISLEKGIVYVNFKGIINIEELISFLKEFGNIEDFPMHLLLLYDLQEADLKINAKDIETISDYSELATQKYISVKTAFLVNEPKLTAYSTLFSELANPNKTQRKIFSTKEATIKWLLKSS